MPMKFKVAAVALLLLSGTSLLSGCGGWQLRGVGAGGAIAHSVYVKDSGGQVVARAVRRELRNRGAKLVAKRRDADMVVEIMEESFDRRILSIDPDTGKVREIELGLATQFSVRDGGGKLLVPRETFTSQVDYIFDETSLLGTTEQDRIVQRDLAEVAATSLALRVQTLRLPSASGE